MQRGGVEEKRAKKAQFSIFNYLPKIVLRKSKVDKSKVILLSTGEAEYSENVHGRMK